MRNLWSSVTIIQLVVNFIFTSVLDKWYEDQTKQSANCIWTIWWLNMCFITRISWIYTWLTNPRLHSIFTEIAYMLLLYRVRIDGLLHLVIKRADWLLYVSNNAFLESIKMAGYCFFYMKACLIRGNVKCGPFGWQSQDDLLLEQIYIHSWNLAVHIT